MALEWTRHDDSTHYINLGRALLVTVINEKMGSPGWKIQVGKRSLKDKIPNLDDAKRVAVAFAARVLRDIQADVDALNPPAAE
ncbi:hypothetical protein [Solidesulfovibrio sp.]|uniref:hypothetical protein n=1 Tax=Solidesulfovibrio sp. TaxID=2910990 RepID=UPI002621887C|nr:hypothetical protein [Solidesulfovibrio sp.]